MIHICIFYLFYVMVLVFLHINNYIITSSCFIFVFSITFILFEDLICQSCLVTQLNNLNLMQEFLKMHHSLQSAKIFDLDTFVIGDGTGVIVLDTSKHPKTIQTNCKLELYETLFTSI